MEPIRLHAAIGFPTEHIRVKLPVPLTYEEGLRLSWTEGTVRVWFSDWDVYRNDPEYGDESLDRVFVSFEFEEFPTRLLALGNPAFVEWGAIRNWIDSDEHMAVYRAATAANYKGEKERQWLEKRKELSAASATAADAWLADPDLSAFLTKTSKNANNLIHRLLELLRVEYGQFMIPDPPRYTWGQVYLRFPDGTSHGLSNEAVDRWLKPPRLTRQRFSGTLDLAQWPAIPAALDAGWKPSLVELLLANARTECDPEFGNPRLAVIEAVTALEVVTKREMHRALSEFKVSKAAIDRIVRETSMADLVGVWLRPHVRPEDFENLESCATAIRERNELVHHERRGIAFDRASEHIESICRLVANIDHSEVLARRRGRLTSECRRRGAGHHFSSRRIPGPFTPDPGSLGCGWMLEAPGDLSGESQQ